VDAAQDYLTGRSHWHQLSRSHYQLGSLYSLYKLDLQDQVKVHFEKVIELDPDGGAGRDAGKSLTIAVNPNTGKELAEVRLHGVEGCRLSPILV